MNFLEKKKEVLLSIIEKLIGVWDIAEGIHLLVKESEVEDPIIDQVLDIMKKSIKNIEDGELKDKLNESIDILEKMREIEKKDREQELSELDDMLKGLDNL